MAVIVAIIAVIALAGGVASWKLAKKSQAPAQEAVIFQPVAPITQTQPVDEAAGWQTYRNEKYGFEFQYPKDLFVVEDGMRILISNNTLDIDTGNMPEDYKSVWIYYDPSGQGIDDDGYAQPTINYEKAVNINGINVNIYDSMDKKAALDEEYASGFFVAKWEINGKEFRTNASLVPDLRGQFVVLKKIIYTLNPL